MLTFKHQRVYDPKSEDVVHLCDISEDIGEDSDFVGPYPFETSLLILGLNLSRLINEHILVD